MLQTGVDGFDGEIQDGNQIDFKLEQDHCAECGDCVLRIRQRSYRCTAGLVIQRLRTGIVPRLQGGKDVRHPTQERIVGVLRL